MCSSDLLRLFLVGKRASAFPLRDFDRNESWTACTPQTAANFSAVAYFFGRAIAEHEHTPIGLIDSTWGGTPAEAWTSLATLASDAALMPAFASTAEFLDDQADVPAMRLAERREDETAAAAHQPRHYNWHPDPGSWTPAWLFNGMVAPATNLAIRGVIWYQGEANAAVDRAPLYAKLFPTLITDWRRQWGQGDFPFLFVQISSYTASPQEIWSVVRDAQLHTLKLVNTGMAVTIDVGDPDNVHPSDKQTVGARLALAARAIAYGEHVEYSGPLFREAASDGGAIRVWFDHAASGLVAKGGALTGFEIAGEDRRFVPAQAHIDRDAVVIDADAIKNPKYVRYGWQNAPVVNLYNGDGLPASPFTSAPE